MEHRLFDRFLEPLESRRLWSAVAIHDVLGAFYQGSVLFDGRTFFAGQDAAHGLELWVTDGTASGTKLLKDVNDNGLGGVYSSYPQSFMPFNDALLFLAKGGPQASDWGLWRTDGTEVGTVKLASNMDATNGQEREGWYLFNGKLVGLSNDGLIETDGTVQGTRLVAADPDSDSLVASTDRLYWLSGSRFTDTYRVKSWDGQVVRVEATAGDVGTNVPRLTSSFGYGIRFAWHNGSGSSGATVQLAPRELVVRPYQERVPNYDHNDDLEFEGMRFYNNDSVLRRVSSTPSEDLTLHSIRRGSLTIAGGQLYFVDGDLGTELWKTDGTIAGTILVNDFAPTQIGYIYGSNSHVYFTVETSSGSAQPWRSNGFSAGTIHLGIPVPPNPGNHSIFGFAQCGTNILMGAWNRLWLIPGTASPIRAPRPTLPEEVLRVSPTSSADLIGIRDVAPTDEDRDDIIEVLLSGEPYRIFGVERAATPLL